VADQREEKVMTLYEKINLIINFIGWATVINILVWLGGEADEESNEQQ